MIRKESEHPWFPVTEVERLLDRAIDGLARLDADLLVQLAHLCREWETTECRWTMPDAIRARLSWKLLLLNRLLRQTSVNLSVLGLEPPQHLSADGYKSFVRR